MGISENIFLGVVSGVLTSFLMYWLGQTFIKIILPWYQRAIYKGVDISGEWSGKIQRCNNIYWSATINLIQNAHSLTGTYTSIKYIDGVENRVSHMKVSGEVWEGFVSLKCRTVSNKHLSFGSMLLKVHNSELEGHQIFRNLAKSGTEIMNAEICLERVGAIS